MEADEQEALVKRPRGRPRKKLHWRRMELAEKQKCMEIEKATQEMEIVEEEIGNEKEQLREFRRETMIGGVRESTLDSSVGNFSQTSESIVHTQNLLGTSLEVETLEKHESNALPRNLEQKTGMEQAQVKRTRGRPRKLKISSEDKTLEKNESKLLQENHKQIAGKEQPLVKRSRCPPRKLETASEGEILRMHQSHVLEESAQLMTEEKEAQVKRPRGRPRKVLHCQQMNIAEERKQQEIENNTEEIENDTEEIEKEKEKEEKDREDNEKEKKEKQKEGSSEFSGKMMIGGVGDLMLDCTVENFDQAINKNTHKQSLLETSLNFETPQKHQRNSLLKNPKRMARDKQPLLKRPRGRPRKNPQLQQMRITEEPKLQEIGSKEWAKDTVEIELDIENEREEEKEEIGGEDEIEKDKWEEKERYKEGLIKFAGETMIGGVRVSNFDCSVETFSQVMDAITSICGMGSEENFGPDAIQRFSSAVTFLTEWKHFNYQPKIIRFAHETLSPLEKEVTDRISLPQFSAANVTQMEKQSSDKSCGNSSNDFVLHVGGQVWGLDWCPRIHRMPDSHMKCEYLAVSTHPPDSSYHKMGAPLIGRGVIQIWCVLIAEEEEPSLPKPKRKNRKRLVRTESFNDLGDVLETEECEGFPQGVSSASKLGSIAGKRKRKMNDNEGAGVNDGLFNSVDNSIIRERDGYDDVVMTSNQRVACQGPFQTSMTSSALAKDVILPRLVICLAHNAKVAWDVKWRPPNSNDPEHKDRMGYLAVLLGNGSLEVWEVPFPRMIKNLYTSINKVGVDPRFVKLEPVFRSSKVMCGDRQSIPLTVEWSTSAPHDLLLAGCHDGMVAMWKFSASSSSRDTRPLLCFTADTVPIRAVAWAPAEKDGESANLVVTAGHEGLRFWDLRDPYRPLWDINHIRRVLSLDWLHEPRCLIFSVDDGTLRFLSLSSSAYDVPVTGKPFVGTNQQGFHSYHCSSFSIWSVHVSRHTGQVAYCGADGSAHHFLLTTKSVEKDPSRNKAPHFLFGSLTIEDSALTINTPLPNARFPSMKSPHEWSKATSASRGCKPTSAQAKGNRGPTLGSSNLLLHSKKAAKATDHNKKKDSSVGNQDCLVGEEQENACGRVYSAEHEFDILPPKMVSMHRVRWNMNKGSERWLGYGGAAGIVRCQEMKMSPVPRRSLYQQ